MSVHAPPSTLPEVVPDARPAVDPVLRCRRCDHAITSPAARVSRGGAHAHTRINPGGWVYTIGCFAEAPGCTTTGPATAAHTWFAGHAWRVALCGACGEHLGWRFEASTDMDAFFGLILERLAGA